MKYEHALSRLRNTITAFTLFVLSACSANYCGELVFNEALNTCECPEGTEPDYDVDACVGDDIVIPWGDVPVQLPDAGQDSGVMDAAPMDAGLSDARPDTGPDAEEMDAGPPPPPTTARFPWNGMTTGSVHVPEDAGIANHPLRPKLIWERVSGVDHYQVQMTRECSAVDFLACLFESPNLTR